MCTTRGAKAPAVHAFFSALPELNAASLNAIGVVGAAAAQCVRSGPNCRCRPSISFPPASGSRICAASGRSPSRSASISPRSRRSMRRRAPSTGSSHRARPSTASTRDSACSRARASTTRGSRSCSARSCCRTAPAPGRCSTTPSCGSSSRSRRPRSRAATRACAGTVIEALVALANAGVVPCIPGAGIGRRVGRPGAARASRRRC